MVFWSGRRVGMGSPYAYGPAAAAAGVGAGIARGLRDGRRRP